ncbi:hypothetical protein HRR83_005953 [Exophiala dermatitidis]|uniref:HhH-GPD domain-containing protein n=1 Tax=Exophiala dermatitidis TaxID=5970 RepID=A0AAN6EM82_EXODE|nr:hypothetical protein HRR75_007407 [Exophiala dermatitidis]KAJ4507149.1 hypothetical protein HRR74_008072 [Exophiala dermatitidis]KAJ4517377.1 hypothetical protein HRR73_004429 [Exophiala dermatitidis]KAJ4548874.1 hypothetical protein HRR76_001452 [Exophiala dermatitidis]KAJ4550653.1 hypothetical protein HRR78_004422 [Exophiala dermatitidis]
MVQTRSQGKANHDPQPSKAGAVKSSPGGTGMTGQKSHIPEKRSHSKTKTEADASGSNTGTSKKVNTGPTTHKKPKHEKEETKDVDTKSGSKAPPAGGAESNSKISKLISTYGTLPLSNTDVKDPQSPTPETMLALLLNAIFSSARISHDLAAKTLATAVKNGYHKIDVLKNSTWDERTKLLTEGGYTRYREKTATALGELVEFLEEKYQGDLNNLLPGSKTDSSPSEVRKRLKEIKGLGDVGVDIFFDTAQGVWPCLAPFIDPRSAKTAEAIGIAGDAGALWESKEVNTDPVTMARLAAALTTVRLEKREGEFGDKT